MVSSCRSVRLCLHCLCLESSSLSDPLVAKTQPIICSKNNLQIRNVGIKLFIIEYGKYQDDQNKMGVNKIKKHFIRLRMGQCLFVCLNTHCKGKGKGINNCLEAEDKGRFQKNKIKMDGFIQHSSDLSQPGRRWITFLHYLCLYYLYNHQTLKTKLISASFKMFLGEKWKLKSLTNTPIMKN